MALFENLGRKKTGVLPYVLLLTIAIIILFLISNTSFQQNRALRQSTKLVTHTQEVISEINMLFGSYSGSQSAGIKYLLSGDSTYLSTILKSRDESERLFKRVRLMTGDNLGQQKNLNLTRDISDQLYTTLTAFDTKIDDTTSTPVAIFEKVKGIEVQLDSLKAIQSEMVTSERNLLTERRADYQSDSTFTPINILYLSLFALGILMFAFSKINSDRKKMAVTRRFLQNILENTDNMVNYLIPVRTDSGEVTDYRVTYVNSQVKAVTGRDPADITGKLLSDIYPYTIQKGLVPLLTEVLKTGKTKTREVNYDIQGVEKWFVSTFAPMEDGITATSRDITADRKAEDILKDLNKRLEIQNIEQQRTASFLQNMLGSIQYVISSFEAVRNSAGEIVDFKIAYTNDKIFDVTGRSPEEIIGKLTSDVYPIIFTNEDFELYKKVIDTGEPIEYEQGYDLKNGYFYFCSEVLKLGDGVTIVSQDITPRKEAQKNLEEVTERLAIQNTVLNDAESVAGLGSYSYNLNTDTLTYSDNCFRLLDMVPGEHIPSLELFTSLIHPEDRQRFTESVTQSLDEKKDVRNIYRVKTLEGNQKDVVLQGHFFEKNKEHFMVGILRDITKEVSNEIILSKRNRDLERSNAELESFNRVVSHDLQEPLRKIQMFISRFSDVDKDKLSKRGITYLKKIDSSANRMQLLIRNLLSYARLADEVESLDKIDLNLVLEKVLDDLSEKIKDTEAKISVPDLPAIYGTEFQLEQLFNNIISNALKYKKHDQPPEIKITSEIVPSGKIDQSFGLSQARYLLLTVADKGVGFESDQSENIFRLFQRLHQKNAYEGTGLGLAICKKIVENHEGRIIANSEPGKGTQIQVYFPFRN